MERLSRPSSARRNQHTAALAHPLKSVLLNHRHQLFAPTTTLVFNGVSMVDSISYPLVLLGEGSSDGSQTPIQGTKSGP